MNRPLIGITTTETTLSTHGSCARAVTLINQAYVELVTSFSAIPILLSYRTPLPQIERLASVLNGLILIGGQDIHPSIFNETLKVQYEADLQGYGKPYLRPLDYQPSIVRDRFEVALYHACKERQMPVFGICRGLQLINVAEGGTLHQELPEPRTIQHERGHDGWIHHHMIEIDPKSVVFTLMKTTSYAMSSLHHQAVDQLGRNLRKVAWSEDGVIEIIEMIDQHHFIVGLHGHVEQTRQNLKLYDNILQAFMERAEVSYALRDKPNRQTNSPLP
ncbi:MAG TPA: gamma-glutamyl-gamma-aminobutyrate hydrolase family protein [Myxococcota bacterium]|nr:gamma-glutamyl-gamma-aminobutyrate hydrolase family protein [Myxococcota bacterium]